METEYVSALTTTVCHTNQLCHRLTRLNALDSTFAFPRGPVACSALVCREFSRWCVRQRCWLPRLTTQAVVDGVGSSALWLVRHAWGLTASIFVESFANIWYEKNIRISDRVGPWHLTYYLRVYDGYSSIFCHACTIVNTRLNNALMSATVVVYLKYVKC